MAETEKNLAGCTIGRIRTDEEADYIDDRLVEFNLSRVPADPGSDFLHAGTKATDGDGNIVGGCIGGNTPWNVGFIDLMWVDERYRGKGLGSALLTELENVLKEDGCYLILLDTFDWQARGFYEKLGYTVSAVIEDCPQGHCRYYMQKRI